MKEIKWEDGAVCFANGWQWFYDCTKIRLTNLHGGFLSYQSAILAGDFQLNEIRQGDYIEASELDTEQKYNDAVEVFGLFGFELCNKGNDFGWFKGGCTYIIGRLVTTTSKLMGVRSDYSSFECQRKITYPQLMAIGKLKRAMIERDSNK